MTKVKEKEGVILKQSQQRRPKVGTDAIIKFIRYFGLVKGCVSFKDKLAMFIWILLESLLYSLKSLKKNGEKKLYEKFCSIYNPVITVRNEDGLFRCRAWTDDILIVNPITEFELRKYFSLKKGIFVDVGAHIGKYTIMVGRKLSEGKIVSIEADPENFEMLKENIAFNGLKNVIALNFAAFSKDGEITLYRSVSPHTSGYSVYLRDHTEAINVKAMKLDDILANLGLERVDLIKIDVEGAEYDVLLGAKKTLEKTEVVICEVIWGEKSEKCKDLLTKASFRLEDLGNNIVAVKNTGGEDGETKNTCNF